MREKGVFSKAGGSVSWNRGISHHGLSVMTYIQLTERPFGAGVLKWFVCFRYVVKQKSLWLQYYDSATPEGGINYLIYANCIGITMNWRSYQVWVRPCRDKGPTLITDERKDSKVGSWMNVQPISKISYCASSYFLKKMN